MREYRRGLAALFAAGLAAVVVACSPPEWGGSPGTRAGAGVGAGQDGASQGTGKSSGNPFGTTGTYLRTRRGVVTAEAEDLRTGETWTLGNGAPQAEASMVKIDILQALLARSPGTPSQAQRALAQKMITVSDNDAATALWKADGGATGIGSYNLAAGLARTRLSACVTCAGFPWPGWGLSATTPGDEVRLLRQLVAAGAQRGASGQALLSASARGYALSLLEHVTPSQRWGVSGGVPAGVTVALKNGWLPLNGGATGQSNDWQVNTAGWVSGDGRDYLLVVMSTHNPSMAYGVATVTRLGSMVWSALG